MFTTKLKYEIVTTIFETIIIILFLLLLYLTYRTKTYQISENIFIDDLLNNWAAKPIKEIYIAEEAEKCEHPFFIRQWEGTDTACDCRTSIHYGVKSDIFKGGCSFMQTAVGCKEIAKQQPIMTNKWKSAKMCIKPYDFNFFDSITIIGNKCPKKYTLCGVDSKNFSICFPKKHGCPINKIKINNSAKTKISEQYIASVKLSDDWYLHYSNQYTNSTMMVDVRYSEGKMCINPSEVNLKFNYFKYKKINSKNENGNNKDNNNVSEQHIQNDNNCKTKVGKFNFDERYQVIDSNSKFKYYTDNNIMSHIGKLPHINSQELINYNSYLYHRSYIHWSPYCRSDANLSPEVMVENLSSLTLLDGLFSFMNYFFIFVFGIYLLSLFIPKSSIDINYIATRMMLFLLLSFIIANILILYILQSYTFIMKKFLSQKCGDYTTNMMFTDIGKNMNELVMNGYKTLLFGIMLFSIIVVNKLIKNVKT